MESLIVGDLKKAIEGVPDETPILYQRIDDFYFNLHGWTVRPLVFEDGESQYINAHSAYHIEPTRVFVINAHY